MAEESIRHSKNQRKEKGWEVAFQEFGVDLNVSSVDQPYRNPEIYRNLCGKLFASLAVSSLKLHGRETSTAWFLGSRYSII